MPGCLRDETELTFLESSDISSTAHALKSTWKIYQDQNSPSWKKCEKLNKKENAVPGDYKSFKGSREHYVQANNT